VAEELLARVVERDAVEVMFLRVADEVSAIGVGWTALEAAVESLRGRKFVGAFDVSAGEYRACVVRRPEDDPATLGLELGVIAGGRYALVRLVGEPPGVYEHIGPTFERLTRQRSDHDRTRPGLEYYRRRDTIDLLLPVA
jgi:hypothetical protein